MKINISDARSEKPIVTECALDLNWIVVDDASEPCDIVWLDYSLPDPCSLVVFNRFPGLHYLARKRSLAQVLRCLSQLHPDMINFFPQTFLIPEEIESIRECLGAPASYCTAPERTKKTRRERTSKNSTFILKPDGGSQGNGLKLANRFSDIPPSIILGQQRYILQQYIQNPMKLKEKKFDIRVYSLITKVIPELEAYISTECLTRFCTENYVSPSRSNLKNVYMHYTNFSINKSNNRFAISTRKKYDAVSIWAQIIYIVQEVILRLSCYILHDPFQTLLAMQPMLMLNYRNAFKVDAARPVIQRCFQILGFDILLDEAGRAWLLEVNSNPSLRTTFDHEEGTGVMQSRIDHYIKYPLVREGLEIVQRRFFSEISVNPQRQLNMKNTRHAKTRSRKNDILHRYHDHNTSSEGEEPTSHMLNKKTHVQDRDLLQLLGNLKYWMPIAFPFKEKKLLDRGVTHNSFFLQGKALLHRLRNGDSLFSMDPHGCTQCYVCWGFAKMAAKRYWRTSSLNKRLLFMCREIFEKATFFPKCLLVECLHWRTLAYRSRMRELLSSVKVPYGATPSTSSTFILPSSSSDTRTPSMTPPVLPAIESSRHPAQRDGVPLENTKSLTQLVALNLEPTPLHIAPSLSHPLTYMNNALAGGMSWSDLEFLFYQKLNKAVYPRSDTVTHDIGMQHTECFFPHGLGFWNTWQLLIELASLLHLARLTLQEVHGHQNTEKDNRKPQDHSSKPRHPQLPCNLTSSCYLSNAPEVCPLKTTLNDYLVQWWPDTQQICDNVLQQDPTGLVETTSWFFQSILRNLNCNAHQDT